MQKILIIKKIKILNLNAKGDINIKFFLFRLTNFYTYHIKSTGFILDPYFRLDSKMHEFFKE